jgi:amidohydrolase
MAPANAEPSVDLRLQERAAALAPELTSLRRDLHRHPELAFEEKETSARIARELSALDLEIRTGVAKTGIVARIRGGGTGGGVRRTVALRADMDALPTPDRKKHVDYRSEVDGACHACGHDGHVAMAVGAARLLAERKADLPGDVVLLFQPAEEGIGGAEPMIAEGALDGVDFILGQHMLPSIAAGEVGVSRGPALAAVDEFLLTIHGRGGHGAYPHLTVDAIVVAAQVITALQTVVSRSVDPLDAAVLSIGMVKGGYNFNVIADKVELRGTVRTLSRALRPEMSKRIATIVRGITEAFGARFDLEYIQRYPATINHDSGVELFLGEAQKALGNDKVHLTAPSMGAEDFAYYLEKIPGAFWWIGCRKDDAEDPGYGLHHPTFDLDERCLPVGAHLLAQSALTYLTHGADR